MDFLMDASYLLSWLAKHEYVSNQNVWSCVSVYRKGGYTPNMAITLHFFKCAWESSGLETVSIVLPRLSHLTAHIIVQANSMGLIPQAGEQNLIENNNLNQNNKQQNKKLKQPKQYNRP